MEMHGVPPEIEVIYPHVHFEKHPPSPRRPGETGSDTC